MGIFRCDVCATVYVNDDAAAREHVELERARRELGEARAERDSLRAEVERLRAAFDSRVKSDAKAKALLHEFAGIKEDGWAALLAWIDEHRAIEEAAKAWRVDYTMTEVREMHPADIFDAILAGKKPGEVKP